jgi:cellulose biosynthesis protein BcsQ
MTRCIAFHSYKGGTGKTTLACNSAALLARKGYKVCLLDLDIYAPSFQSYFDREPIVGINDFLNSNVEVDKAMIDYTSAVENLKDSIRATVSSYPYPTRSENEKKIRKRGELWIGFSNLQKKGVFELENADSATKRDIIRRFIYLRERLISDFHADYIIIDTSPGMRFWSINSLAIADILLLTLKMGSLDVDGTRIAVNEIYKSFTKFGSKAYLLFNLIAGYCVPEAVASRTETVPSVESTSVPQGGKTLLNKLEGRPSNEVDFAKSLSSDLGIPAIISIPCYCDIQFSRREFFTVLRCPEHPFTKQIEGLVSAL